MAFEVMKNAMQASIENNWGNLEKLPPIKVALTQRKFLSSYCRCWCASPTWTSRSKWATRVVGWTGWQLTRCSNTCTPLHPPQVSLQKLCPSLDLVMAYPSPDSMLGAKIWRTLVSYCFPPQVFPGGHKGSLVWESWNGYLHLCPSPCQRIGELVTLAWSLVIYPRCFF